VLERGFETLLGEHAALEMLLSGVRPLERQEDVALDQALGRVTAEPVHAARDVPHYERSAMDGFAVRAEDTAGAAPAGPVRFDIAPTSGRFRAVPVHTGSALPDGADAVLPVEDAEREGSHLDVLRRLRPGEHVGRRGEDVQARQTVLPAGHVLRAQDLGLLRALGIESLVVVGRPRVRILPTGEELVPPGSLPPPGRMIDSNGLMLSACVREWGGQPEIEAFYSDEPDELARSLAASTPADLLVTSGGSSVGERDQVVAALGRVGRVLFHGVAIQPARPVAAGSIGEVPVLCLPGYPAATFISAYVFLRPVLLRLARRPSPAQRKLRGVLTRKIVSTLGLRTYVRVSVAGDRVTPVRTSGAGVLSSVVRAQGFVVVPEESEGIPDGAEVEVLLYD
jgi:molybdopterin molybdotransferase